MSHPTPARLLDLHFGELSEVDQAACAAHAAGCAACAAFLTELGALERALGPTPLEGPPSEGLEKVLARVERLRPARRRRELGLRVLLPGALGATASTLALHQAGVLGLLALFAAGALVTLALAPVLILDSQRRSS